MRATSRFGSVRRGMFGRRSPRRLRTMSMPTICSLIIAASLATATAAGAAPAEDAVVKARDDDRRFSLTFSPVHLVLPVVEVTGELRAADRVGVAVVAGAGTVPIEGLDERVFAYEIGAQGRFYLLGDFDGGLQVGAEALWLGASSDDVDGVEAVAAGLAIGPFAGYKHTFSFGLTLDGQVGAQYIAIAAEASDGDRTETEADQDVIVLLNLNVGWSF
jgi:hypothetical protein